MIVKIQRPVKNNNRVSAFIKGVVLLFLGLFTLFNIGCGIESVTVLNEPLPGRVDDANKTVTFQATSKNDEIQFKGFDIYYKFYGDPEALMDDMNLSISNPTDLVKRGFFKITSSSDIQGNPTEPLISIPPLYRGSEYTITIDFSNIFFNPNNQPSQSDPLIYADNSDIISSLEIKRGVPDVSGVGYKAFYDYCFTCPDADLKDLTNVDPNTDNLYIAFYAFSYGSDFENTYYSNACYLGYLTITLSRVLQGE